METVTPVVVAMTRVAVMGSIPLLNQYRSVVGGLVGGEWVEWELVGGALVGWKVV